MAAYRISLGLDLKVWTNLHEDRFTTAILTTDEAESWTRVRATGIFYSDDPDAFLKALGEDGFSVCDFKWINISQE